MSAEISEKVNLLYRDLSGKMVASLASYFGLTNLAMAEDIVQETFITAFEQWQLKGLPEKPDAWLFKVCKNKAINAIAKKQTQLSGDMSFPDKGKTDYQFDQLFLDHEIKDNQLRLLFACCNHSLSPKAQVVLILKHICGLRIEEIARALAMTDEAVMKMCARSRQTLIAEKVTMHVPFLLRSHEKLHTVHLAIYLLFNEGYQATNGNEAIRKELCIEALRLIKTILDISEIKTNDTYALMALMCFHTARFESRISNNEFIDLENQDRSLWDKDLIRLASYYLKQIIGSTPTRFILEAAIAALHCNADAFSVTNWAAIKELYDQLLKIQPSPFVDVNRATAIFFSEGPAKALTALEQSPHRSWYKNYYMYYALLAKIYKSKGENALAIENYERAMSLASLEQEKKYLQNQVTKLS
ncbi:RNA polymerase sigma factor [Chryseosolibacter indicus]|uniref:RNA polymerase sigma factor n=1 Tax=Chryseosolibacter indicus TaxID=2782351 RepID=A0ABS5VSQ4_9BACT|nr:sigma-70 family RNA polymerase sigma factor [Chryseosolibacter indicus]MBT1703837.1 sigma-70 family RNA polymerase sigma factor [Chryseosolibacter indicus]